MEKNVQKIKILKKENQNLKKKSSWTKKIKFEKKQIKHEIKIWKKKLNKKLKFEKKPLNRKLKFWKNWTKNQNLTYILDQRYHFSEKNILCKIFIIPPKTSD